MGTDLHDGPSEGPPRAPPLRGTTLAFFDAAPAAGPDWYAIAFLAGDAAPALAIDDEGIVTAATPAVSAILSRDRTLVGQGITEIGFLINDFEAWKQKAHGRATPVPGFARLTTPGRLARTVPIAGMRSPAHDCMIVWIEAPDADAAAFRVSDVAPVDLLRVMEAAANEANVGLAINTVGPDGQRRLATINLAGARMLGKAPRELIATAPFPPNRTPTGSGGPITVPWEYAGGQRMLELGVSPGHFEGTEAQFVVFTDVTAAQPDEQERKRLVQELFNANVDLRNFARATTHDLRAPLRSISGFAALLERRIRATADPDDLRLVNNVIASTRRMDDLVEALAAYAALGARQTERSQVDLNTILGDVLSDLASVLDQGDVRLEFSSLPSVEGDALLLRQLFQNLLGNAVKFRHVAPHRVRLDAEQDGEWVILRFIDNGIGIDLSRAHDLFQPFRRFHDVATFPGSGLGLATCRRIVEMHGGRIDVASEPGVGSTFTVRLPK